MIITEKTGLCLWIRKKKLLSKLSTYNMLGLYLNRQNLLKVLGTKLIRSLKTFVLVTALVYI